MVYIVLGICSNLWNELIENIGILIYVCWYILKKNYFKEYWIILYCIYFVLVFIKL